MKNPNPQFDGYFAKSAEFARPIMERIRKAAHQACPDIHEVMKWSAPAFELDGIVAGMSAHQAHVRFGFWKGKLLEDADGLLEKWGSSGITGMRLEKVSDLPTQRVLVGWFKAAVQWNREGVKAAPAKKKPAKRPPPKAPTDLLAALKKRKKALATYEGFSPSNKREYVEWITGAKRDATREKRIAQAVVWMAEGKPRNWKYMNS